MRKKLHLTKCTNCTFVCAVRYRCMKYSAIKNLKNKNLISLVYVRYFTTSCDEGFLSPSCRGIACSIFLIHDWGYWFNEVPSKPKSGLKVCGNLTKNLEAFDPIIPFLPVFSPSRQSLASPWCYLLVETVTSQFNSWGVQPQLSPCSSFQQTSWPTSLGVSSFNPLNLF